MSERLKVAVLGPIPRDRVITHRGDVLEKYGCALYTAVALSTLLAPDDVVVPVVNVQRRDEDAIKDLLSLRPNIDLTGIRSDLDAGDVVELRYVDQNRRIERQTGFMAPILPEHVEFALDADAFVCVPITDYEVGPITLQYLKQHGKGLVLLDGHGPTNALVPGGQRQHRLWVDRDAWLPHVDVLKMNLEEAGCSWFATDGDPDEPGTPIALEHLPRFAKHCLRAGVQAVCVTLDQEGCVAYTLDERGDLQEHLVPRIPVAHVVDTTGCGDSFAAGMAFGFLQDHDIVSACRYGNAMGAQRCSAQVLDAYLPLEQTNDQLARTYGVGQPAAVAAV